MTLQPYGPERFDELALRILDVAAVFREMAAQQRQHDAPTVNLNDRKLLEWLSCIEVWAQDARGRQQTEITRNQGAQRAKALARGKK